MANQIPFFEEEKQRAAVSGIPFNPSFLQGDAGAAVDSIHFHLPFLTPINGINLTKGDKCVNKIIFWQKNSENNF